MSKSVGFVDRPTGDGEAASAPIVEGRDLHREFRTRGAGGAARVHAVNGVSLSIQPGETLGLVGESGSGKSTLARMLAALDKPTSGSILFGGADIARLSGRRLRAARRNFQMVFQDPSTSLDPRWKISRTISEPLRAYSVGSPQERRERVDELLTLVGLDTAMASRLPNELSGGQRQRVGIARAIALRPSLIVADEPVSALDVSVQAQVINLLKDLQDELGFGCLFIGHGLSVVRHISHRVAVMYMGAIVEIGPTDELYDAPVHPYTYALLSAAPAISSAPRPARILLQGDPPSPSNPPTGCRFHPRCPLRPHLAPADQLKCSEVVPVLADDPVHGAACHFPLNAERMAALNNSSRRPQLNKN